MSLLVQSHVLRAETFLELRSQFYKTGAALSAQLLVSVELCLDVPVGMVEAVVCGEVAVPFPTHRTFFTYTSTYITLAFEFPLAFGT